VIIGAHSPEFAFERKLENLTPQVKDFGLEYAIFQDNDFKTWRAYGNRYWPAKYIIDKQGRVRYTHFGEGNYEETELVIQFLLNDEKGLMADRVDFSAVESPSSGVETGETYLGTGRHVVAGSLASIDPRNFQPVFVSPEAVSEAGSSYSKPDQVKLNQWWLSGSWVFDEEKITSLGEQSVIGLNYKAAQVNLVMGFRNRAVQVEVWLDGEKISVEDVGRMGGELTINDFQLYYLSEHDQVEEHSLELRFMGPGVEAYAFTFG